MSEKVRSERKCAYCGCSAAKFENEHVIPSALYPKSLKPTNIQRVTIKACTDCNRAYARDESHFRSVLSLSGEPNEAVHALWKNKVLRSFDQTDGRQQVEALSRILKEVTHDGERRLAIYPAESDRVLRVVKKIARGLSCFHKIECGVDEARMSADVLRYAVPDNFTDDFEYEQREPSIVDYWYKKPSSGDPYSYWFLRFFQRTTFVATIHPPRVDSTSFH